MVQERVHQGIIGNAETDVLTALRHSFSGMMECRPVIAFLKTDSKIPLDFLPHLLYIQGLENRLGEFAAAQFVDGLVEGPLYL